MAGETTYFDKTWSYAPVHFMVQWITMALAPLFWGLILKPYKICINFGAVGKDLGIDPMCINDIRYATSETILFVRWNLWGSVLLYGLLFAFSLAAYK